MGGGESQGNGIDSSTKSTRLLTDRRKSDSTRVQSDDDEASTEVAESMFSIQIARRRPGCDRDPLGQTGDKTSRVPSC